jgi:hypothetical protein
VCIINRDTAAQTIARHITVVTTAGATNRRRTRCLQDLLDDSVLRIRILAKTSIALPVTTGSLSIYGSPRGNETGMSPGQVIARAFARDSSVE